MRCFDYPFDPAFILQKKRALRRELLASEGLVPKKVAILSGSTVGEIKNILELFLLNAGIRPEFYVGGYALFYEELTFDADGALAAFAPDVIYVHTSARNLGNLPLQTDTPEQAEEKFAAECARWQGMWKAAARFGCPVVQNNFELPGLRVMGSMDAVDPHGRVRFVCLLYTSHFLAVFRVKNTVLILVKGAAGKPGHLGGGRNILRAARRQKLLGL